MDDEFRRALKAEARPENGWQRDVVGTGARSLTR